MWSRDQLPLKEEDSSLLFKDEWSVSDKVARFVKRIFKFWTKIPLNLYLLPLHYNQKCWRIFSSEKWFFLTFFSYLEEKDEFCNFFFLELSYPRLEVDWILMVKDDMLKNMGPTNYNPWGLQMPSSKAYVLILWSFYFLMSANE